MDLKENPFFVLRASTVDNRAKIQDLAEDASLLLDPRECSRAGSVLTNPRKRVSAEVSWLPGLSLNEVDETLSLLERSPSSLLSMTSLPSLARANLLASGLFWQQAYSPDTAANWILEVARAFDEIEAEDVCETINLERIASGFPPVSDLSVVESEIQSRRRHFLGVADRALGSFPKEKRIQAVTFTVETATNGGEERAPDLIYDLVDSHEAIIQEEVNQVEGEIEGLVAGLREAADGHRSDQDLGKMVGELIQMVEGWDVLVQPIQLSRKSRGRAHEASKQIGLCVRSVAIDLFNEHDKIELSTRLIKMLQSVFAEVPAIADHTAEDFDALEEIAEGRKERLNPILVLCLSAIEATDRNAFVAADEARKLLAAAPQLLANLAAVSRTRELVSVGQDSLARAVLHCAVAYGNETEDWKGCILMLDGAMKLSDSQELQVIIKANLQTIVGNESLSAQSNERTKVGGGWIVGIIGVILIIWIINSQEDVSKAPAPRVTQSFSTPSKTLPVRSNLDAEIEKGKLQAKQMEVQLDNFDRELEGYKEKLNMYEVTGRVDEFNRMVVKYNSRLLERNQLWKEYDSLIDEINRKVNRFNSGFR